MSKETITSLRSSPSACHKLSIIRNICRLSMSCRKSREITALLLSTTSNNNLARFNTYTTHNRFTALWILSGTLQVRWYQKGKTNLDFTEARDCEWQWYQLGHMQICTSPRQITTQAPHHSAFTGWMPFLPPNQQHQITEGTTITQQYRVIYCKKTRKSNHSLCESNASSLQWKGFDSKH